MKMKNRNKNKKILILGFVFLLMIFSMGVVAISFSDIFNSIFPAKEKQQQGTQQQNEKSIISEKNYSINAPVIEVTVYSNNMAFVKRQGFFNVDEESENVLVLEILNFTQPIKDSLFVHDNKARLKEFYFKDVEKIEEIKENVTPEFEEILNESLGKEIKVKVDNDSFTGKLVWLRDEKIGIEYSNGILFLNLYDIKEFLIPGANVTKREKSENSTVTIPILIIKEIPTEKGMHNLLLSYLRNGITWNANHKFYTNSEKEEDFGTLQSWAFVTNNADENWNDVSLKLVVGYPNIVYYYQPVYRQRTYAMEEKVAYGIAGAPPMPPMVEEQLTPEPIGEYTIYTLDEKVSINSSESKNLPIFSRDIKFKRKYLWNANLGNEVYKIYEINNTLDVPFAEGVFSVYLKGEFEGQDKIKYTAKESLAEVKVAKAPDIVAKKEILEKTTEEGYEDQMKFPNKYSTKTYYKVRLTIESHKDSDVTMLIKDEMQQGDQVNFISGTIKPEVKLYFLKWDNLKLKSWEKKVIDYEYEVKNFYVR